MAPNLTQEQIDELESRGIMTPATSQSMRSQMMSEMEDTPKPLLDKVLMDTMISREQDNADTIPNKIAQDAASNPELKDIVERTAMKLHELTAKPQTLSSEEDRAKSMALAAKWGGAQVHTTPVAPPPPPVDRIENPAVLPPPAQEEAIAEEAPGPNLGQMQLDALDMKGQAAMMRAGDEQRAGNARAAFIERTAADLQAAEDARLLQRAELERKRNEQLAKVEEAQAKFDTMQIDPNQFYGTRTTEQNILLNLGLALSVFGGNTKEYTDNIYKAIDRDIDLQKEQINLQGSKVTGARNVLSDMMAVTKDVDTAAEMARAGMLKQAELKGAAMAARVSNADAKAKLLDTVADLQMKRAEIMSKMTGIDSLDQQIAAKAIKGGTLILDEKTLAQVIKGRDKKDLPAVTVPGLGIANTPQDADEVKKVRSAYQNLNKDLDELIRLRGMQSPGGGLLPDSIVDQGRSIWGRISSEVRNLTRMGTLDAPALAVIGDMMPRDPLGVSLRPDSLASFGIKRIEGDPLLAVIGTFRDGVRQSMASTIENRMQGVVPSEYDKIIAPGKKSDLRSKLKEVETPKGIR